MGDMDEMMDGMSGWMMIMPIGGLVVLAALIATVVWVIRARPAERQIPQKPSDETREILDRRYASGEIDDDEYFRRSSGLDQP